jgi:uncharacterized DUF497 family protein
MYTYRYGDVMVSDGDYEWDEAKKIYNIEHGGTTFKQAEKAFDDLSCIIIKDTKHSHRKHEDRYFCLGYDGHGILTVRFTRRNHKTRIFGAGYWRKEKEIYEERNGKIH